MKPSPPFLPLLLSLIISLYLHVTVSAISLSTNSRWIVNESGTRVKLACVSWPSQLETMLAEGLDKQPLDVISKSIASRGFNCVRLTYAIFMLTNDSLSSLKVRESFKNYNLTKSIEGIEKNNPSILNLTLIQAYKNVVSNLEENNVMVILDNHVSEPGWCCSKEDGNGFFGDKYFNPSVWIEGLERMATMFSGSSNVVGMSLRNELRGPNQTIPNWYKYMQMGAEAVHKANPKVLVILSGLYFDTDLSFLSNKQVKLSFKEKLVFEVHWYSFSNSEPWSKLNTNQACGRITKDIMRKAGFLVHQGWPLFMSEFGVDYRGLTDNDNRYLGCMLGLLAEMDLDWALWTLSGSFYLREGVVDMDETYAVLNHDWSETRNSTILRKIQAVEQPFRGPGLSDLPPHKKIFHPSTGLCITQDSTNKPLELSQCHSSTPWNFIKHGKLALNQHGKQLCLKPGQVNEPAILGENCSQPGTKWKQISHSKMHLMSKDSKNRKSLCLDVGDDRRTIVTKPCKCLSKLHGCDPTSQWFRLVDSTTN